MAVNVVPLAYLVVAVGLAARAEPDSERAARASGAGPLTVLWTVTLPLLRPAIATASILVFVLTLGTFAIPQVMGSPAGFSTVTTRIYANLARSSDPADFVEAVALALLLVVIAVVIVLPADWLLGPRLRSTRVATTDPTAVSTSVRWPAGGRPALTGGYVLLTFAVPLAALVSAALTRAAGLAPIPANWTLANIAEVITPRNAEALGRSLGLAATAATLLVLLGGCVAALERTRWGRGAGTLVTLSLVLPGSTLAVGLLITYGRWIGGTLLIILLAYVAKLWAFAHRPISGALDRLPPDEVHAARASGARPLTALRSVVLRPLLPALLARVAGVLPHRPARGHHVEPPLRAGGRDPGGRRPQQPGARSGGRDLRALPGPHAPARPTCPRRVRRGAPARPAPARTVARLGGRPCRVTPWSCVGSSWTTAGWWPCHTSTCAWPRVRCWPFSAPRAPASPPC